MWNSQKLLDSLKSTVVNWTRGRQSPRFKKFGEIRLGSKLSLDLIYGLSFRIKAASYFPQSWIQKTGLIFYLADLNGRNAHSQFLWEQDATLSLIFH